MTCMTCTLANSGRTVSVVKMAVAQAGLAVARAVAIGAACPHDKTQHLRKPRAQKTLISCQGVASRA